MTSDGCSTGSTELRTRETAYAFPESSTRDGAVRAMYSETAVPIANSATRPIHSSLPLRRAEADASGFGDSFFGLEDIGQRGYRLRRGIPRPRYLASSSLFAASGATFRRARRVRGS